MPRFFSKTTELNLEKQEFKIPVTSQFKITKGAIEELYSDDAAVIRNVNQSKTPSSSLGSLSLDSLDTAYFNLGNLDQVRQYSREAYTYHPVYSTMLNSLSNMYYWRYVFYPRLVKEASQNAQTFDEIYAQMAEVVDGLNIETTMPMLLTNLLINGSLFVTTVRRTGSKTLTTLILPHKYCRTTGITQYNTGVYQFDLSYFDSLGLSQEQLNILFDYYPKEMRSMYQLYQNDQNLNRWQKMNPKNSAAFVLNDNSFPTYLRALSAIMQYDQYRDNELTRNEQQLQKIIAHKLPTWEDKLVVEVPEMKALHKGMSKVLAKNKNTKMLTTFGDLEVLSIGDDQTKENKTLKNAYSTIFNLVGENDSLYIGNSKESLEFSLRRQESIIWRYIEQFVAFYMIAVNNQFNFKGYQCSLSILPLTVYNFDKTILQYKEGATLGVCKLEYMVGMGVKQIDIAAKMDLENYLKLDQLKPLSSSHTQGLNAAGKVADQGTETEDEEEPIEDTKNTEEVQNEEE